MPGQTLELPFLGSIMHFRLPQRSLPQFNDNTPAPPTIGIDENVKKKRKEKNSKSNPP